MPEPLLLTLPDEAATARLGGRLAQSLHQVAAAAPFIIYLEGALGAGKTALARSILQALGVSSAVRSPTYTLMELYEVAGLTGVHLDLYRLAEAQELEHLGLRELLEPRHVWLVEWPQRGAGVLPGPDLTVALQIEGEGRRVRLTPATALAVSLLTDLAGNL